MGKSKISAILLAAGMSSRMIDKNKLMMQFGNQSILNQSLKNIANSNVSEVIVVLGHDHDVVVRSLERGSTKIRIVYNPDYSSGMTTSIKKGIGAVSGDVDGFMICLADMPLIRDNQYNSLMDFFNVHLDENKKLIAYPFVKGKKANPVIFSAYYQESILTHSAMNGCNELVKENKLHVKLYETDEFEFTNDIDTLGDYNKLFDLK